MIVVWLAIPGMEFSAVHQMMEPSLWYWLSELYYMREWRLRATKAQESYQRCFDLL